MGLILSILLFFAQAFFLSEGDPVDFLISTTEIEITVDSNEESQKPLLLYNSLETEKYQNNAYLEQVEEEEKSESEKEEFSRIYKPNFFKLLRFQVGRFLDPAFTTKAISQDIPLYTLFHSWKSFSS